MKALINIVLQASGFIATICCNTSTNSDLDPNACKSRDMLIELECCKNAFDGTIPNSSPCLI